MKYYMAPLEGVTTYVYRNAYHKYFQKMDKYYTPFIVPHHDKKFSTRELKELSPEHNEGLHVVPQLLTNNADDFMKTSKDIQNMGYQEINLNFGCPSKTVVTKKRGSGFLAYPEELDYFLEEVFSKSDMEISVKTRVGKDNPEEFYRILDIYNKYPIKELTIHPRVQADYYNNTANWDIYEYAYNNSKNPLCYNGDIHSKSYYNEYLERFPNTEAVMLGRGVIKNPGLVSIIDKNLPLSKEVLYQFHNQILEDYIPISSGDRNVLFKMKELWFYMIGLFENADKLAKKIKKTERISEYEKIISTLFDTCALREE